MKTRGYNFGAGPATLPESILKEAQNELLNWQDTGMSILELGHRTDEFMALMNQAESDLRELLSIPSEYQVLFLGGAARTQFAMIPMNLLASDQNAGYLISGIWSGLAYREAQKVMTAYCLASSETEEFTTTPDISNLNLRENTAYVYYTPNETINGVYYSQIPKVEDIPLVADMTSCLLSEPIEVTKFGLIFAGAQKNISTAGLTLAIIRNDLLESIPEKNLPAIFDYHVQAQYRSLYATPPVFSCYLAAKMFRWIKEQGGVTALHQMNCQKAAKLYDFIDSSSFYDCRIKPQSRSIMNVCFTLPTKNLELEFIDRARENGLLALKGHRLVGGLRASLYNAMPMAGVEALIEFMQNFAKGFPE